MRRRILIALFAFGTLGGYGAGIAGMSCRAHARRDAFERHVAHICADAARNPASAPTEDEPGYPW
jgi:hypothetical protein